MQLKLTRVSELGDVWMNGDALGAVDHRVAAAGVPVWAGRAEQAVIGRPPEVVEAAEVADVGRAAWTTDARVVLRVAAHVHQGPARIWVKFKTRPRQVYLNQIEIYKISYQWEAFKQLMSVFTSVAIWRPS